MAEYTRPLNENEFEKNFAQKKPLMNSTEAFYESSRCLFCYDAPCINACPTHIDIPLFIKQIHTGNIEGSAKTIYEANWMGNACAKVCPTQTLCEGACVYNLQHVKPIEIGRLQNFATLQTIEKGKTIVHPGVTNGKKVAIIGAGPASISCACELRVIGFEVDIFESKNQPSGLNAHGVAPYKITNNEALIEVDFLQKQLGFHIKYNQTISTQEQIVALEKNYDAIFLGVGLGASASINLTGENLKGVIGAVEFVEELRATHHNMQIPEKVIVLGGGNTAMDAASESARMGATEVTLAYRRSKEEMGAYYFEYDLAIHAGVRSVFNAAPIEILGAEKVSGVKFIKTQITKGKLENIPNSEFIIECDLLIKATGQAKQIGLYSLLNSVEIDSQKRVIVNENFQTTNNKYFAGGDAVNGGAEVVNAAFEGKMAAKGIQKYIFSN